ncbi:MAG: phage baseplate assembly protein V [Thermoproteota archaeon]|nr:phage baseplate assembly protein V [Thermoproteota archaeon]
MAGTSTEFNQTEINVDTKISGVVTGLITDNNDPHNLGRVRVHFSWPPYDNETDWIKIFGSMIDEDSWRCFSPRIGEEVLVAFEHGDFNRPLVLGLLWNKQQVKSSASSLENLDKNNEVKKIITRGGHEIIFDDAQGNDQIEIHTKAGHNIVFDESRNNGSEKIVISKEIPEERADDRNFIELNSYHNSILVSARTDLNIKAANIEIEAAGIMSLKSGSTMTINGSLIKIN